MEISLIWVDKTPEEMELYVDYEMDSEDEMFLENLRSADSDCNLSSVNFEQIIHSLEVQAYKKVLSLPRFEPMTDSTIERKCSL